MTGLGEATTGSARAAHNKALGAYGEEMAARYLVDAGMVVLDRNWRGVGGELDLVLKDGATLVVCEVKTRSSAAFGSPHEAVTEAKLRRLQRLAAQWLRASGARAPEIRIDVVAVMRPRRGAASIDHVRGVG